MAQPLIAPQLKRFLYKGQDVPRLNFPQHRFAFRPNLLTDNQVIGIIKLYPWMKDKYFTDLAEVEEE